MRDLRYRGHVAKHSDYDYSRTQPVCGPCYSELYPNREPFVLREPDAERCCKCGRITGEGIYLRVDPATVPYPSRFRADDA